MMHYLPRMARVEADCAESELAVTLKRRLPGLPLEVVGGRAPSIAPDDFASGKQLMILARNWGRFLGRCPAGRCAVRCCGYLVLNLTNNCPMDCHYCFLQDYLSNSPALTLYTNISEALEEVEFLLKSNPGRRFRVGTGEFADSLALDSVTGVSRQLVPFFAARETALLELKTKTTEISELLEMDPRGRVVVSWSLAPQKLIPEVERETAPLAARLAAARRCQEGGYKVGFHFDPLIDYPGWRRGYTEVVEMLCSAVDPRAVAWLSMGSLRLTRRLREIIRRRFPESPVLGGEYIEGLDGKLRLFRPARVAMYKLINSLLHRGMPGVPVYLCMEPPEVWEQVFCRPAPREVELAGLLASR